MHFGLFKYQDENGNHFENLPIIHDQRTLLIETQSLFCYPDNYLKTQEGKEKKETERRFEEIATKNKLSDTLATLFEEEFKVLTVCRNLVKKSHQGKC